MLSLVLRRAAAATASSSRAVTPRTAAFRQIAPSIALSLRQFSEIVPSATEVEGELDQQFHAVVQDENGDVLYVVPDIDDSLEWCLTSPPPLHQFDESPLIVETDHLVKKN
mmetsp:Transcript_4211/g.8794  ORF Transcript_4211/g.8794 Transcript_4211/m.8794 type:complete len:111 (+) Transcript_4211:114-446(+)